MLHLYLYTLKVNFIYLYVFLFLEVYVLFNKQESDLVSGVHHHHHHMEVAVNSIMVSPLALGIIVYYSICVLPIKIVLL
jgi:hypothetical protein